MSNRTNASFVDKLRETIERNNSLLCLGLDPDPHQFPAYFPRTIDTGALVTWGKTLIDQTAGLVCCYKPNIAFYEQYGPAGLEALRQTIAAVPDNIPVLLDAKRGDIGTTAAAYARAVFEILGADAVTVNPYLGQDSISPFLAYPGKMVFILDYTSNPSAREIQEFGRGEQLFQHIARRGQRWGGRDQVGFVVGATQPQALADFRRLAPDRWILAPGIGAQGGDLAAALAAGLDSEGSRVIIPVSRGVLYTDDPQQAALKLRDEINQARQTPKAPDKAPGPYRELVLRLHELGCLQFGQFTLASGQSSPIYIDLRRIPADPALLQQVAEAYARLLQPLAFDRLAAVPYAGLPLGTAIALTIQKPLIYPRKEVKNYGTGRTIEGVYHSGETVVIIEDLVTSGGSVLKSIDLLQAAGLRVSDVTVLIDREQGGRAALAGQGYQLHAALRFSDILEIVQAAGRISGEQVGQVRRYLEGV